VQARSADWNERPGPDPVLFVAGAPASAGVRLELMWRERRAEGAGRETGTEATGGERREWRRPAGEGWGRSASRPGSSPLSSM
jgi:hypothetical protein